MPALRHCNLPKVTWSWFPLVQFGWILTSLSRVVRCPVELGGKNMKKLSTWSTKEKNHQTTCCRDSMEFFRHLWNNFTNLQRLKGKKKPFHITMKHTTLVAVEIFATSVWTGWVGLKRLVMIPIQKGFKPFIGITRKPYDIDGDFGWSPSTTRCFIWKKIQVWRMWRPLPVSCPRKRCHNVEISWRNGAMRWRRWELRHFGVFLELKFF